MWKSVGLMAFLLVFLGYWVYHLTNGPRSIFVRGQIIQERAHLSAEIEGLQIKSRALRQKIAGLRLETLDEDLLVERLHAMSLTLPGEILLYSEN